MTAIRILVGEPFRPRPRLRQVGRRARVNFEIRYGAARIHCRTRPCADYVVELLEELGIEAAADRINRALAAEADPMTRFPPRGAGDVVGQVAA